MNDTEKIKIVELHTDPIYIFTDKAEAIPFIIDFQKLLIKKGLGSQVVLHSDIFHLGLGLNNCYPAKNYEKWTDLCLNRNKVLAIKFNDFPEYSVDEFFELITKETKYMDDYIEFFEC